MVRIQSKVVVGLLASLSLYACGQRPVPVEANPYANGADYPWTYVRPEAQLSFQTLTPGENTLYYEPILSATNGWGPLEIDRSNGEQGANDGRTITLNGVTYKKGLGVHAGSDVRYSLRGTGASCVRLTTDIGVDDEVGNRGSVVFQVYLDGTLAYDSGTMTGRSATKKLSLDITGKQLLRLVVTDAGDNKHYDHADWANPRITCVASTPGPSGSLDPGFGVAGRVPVGGVDSVVEPDDSVVALGSDFTLRRLSSVGALSGTGAVSVPGGAAYALARQSNGNLVAVGEANGAVVAVRYLPTLQPDPGFGTGGVKIVQLGVTDPVSGVARSYARDVVVQPDGKVVLVGSASVPYSPYPGETGTTLDYLVSRLSQDGTPDAGFGVGGSFVLENTQDCDSPNTTDEMLAVALQPDGKVVAAGSANCIGAYRNVIVRLQSNGHPDPAFSGDGKTSASVSGGYGNLIRALLIQPDGAIVFGGATQRFQTAAFVERVTAGGAPEGGMVFQISGNFYEQGTIYSLARQNDGRIVFGASSPNDLNLGRLTADLALDTSFGSLGTGYVFVQPAITSVNIDAAGRIVGSSTTDTVRVLP